MFVINSVVYKMFKIHSLLEQPILISLILSNSPEARDSNHCHYDKKKNYCKSFEKLKAEIVWQMLL